MSIFVSLEDKDGEPLVPVFDIGRVHRRFGKLTEGICLRFVSEEHDAFFNIDQVPFLLDELNLLGKEDLPPDERSDLDRIVSTVVSHSRKRDVYVKFYGEKGGE